MFVKFLPFSFHVKDFSTRAILMQGATKDGVYEWLHTSSDLNLVITFFSLKVFVDQWHHHLEHLSSQVLSHLISHQSLPMSSSTMYKFNCTLVIAIRLINCHFFSHLFTNSHPTRLKCVDLSYCFLSWLQISCHFCGSFHLLYVVLSSQTKISHSWYL